MYENKIQELDCSESRTRTYIFGVLIQYFNSLNYIADLIVKNVIYQGFSPPDILYAVIKLKIIVEKEGLEPPTFPLDTLTTELFLYNSRDISITSTISKSKTKINIASLRNYKLKKHNY